MHVFHLGLLYDANGSSLMLDQFWTKNVYGKETGKNAMHITLYTFCDGGVCWLNLLSQERYDFWRDLLAKLLFFVSPVAPAI